MISTPRPRWLGTLLIVASVAISCGSDEQTSADSAPSSSMTSSTTTTTTASTTLVPTTAPATVPPTTTTTTSTTTTAPTTLAPTTAAPTTSTLDEDPPSAPTGLVCESGGGSGEIGLSWDAPPDAADITTVRAYLRELGGSFARIARWEIADGVIATGSDRWSFSVFPVPTATPVEFAVTHGDAAGNESGWDTVDGWYAYSAGPCLSGPPPAPTVNVIQRGAGSGEATILADLPAADVVDWRVVVDQGSGFVEPTLSITTLSPTLMQLVVYPLDWAQPTTYRITAIDAHGFESPTIERACPPISPGDVAC